MSSDDFYQNLPALTQFAAAADLKNYRPVPGDWCIATTDVVSSTKAIEDGQYKLVNTAGASGISAVANALGHHRSFPFVFGGDGAAFAVPEAASGIVADALAAVCVWVREELNLELRAAIVPVSELRKQGGNVLVARFCPAPDVYYAMFAGGGAGLAELLMKQGENLIAPAPPGARPDLTGLSCRWQPMKTDNGHVVSLVVVPRSGDGNERQFMELARDILTLAGSTVDQSSPVHHDGPPFPWPPSGLAIETAATAIGLARTPRLGSILMQQLIGWVSDRTGRSFGRFNARRYRREVAVNSDFRKFDDGLKLTLDLSEQTLGRIEERLEQAEAAGVILFGIHTQNTALMTCIVPSAVSSDHIHFVDGAEGGYVRAAIMLKEKLQKLS